MTIDDIITITVDLALDPAEPVPATIDGFSELQLQQLLDCGMLVEWDGVLCWSTDAVRKAYAE